MPFAASPPEISSISPVALRRPRSASSARMARSNRYDASVFIRSAVRVRRVLTGSKLAASSSTDVVFSSISVLAPPITPASPIASRESAMHSIGGFSARRTPSSVSSVSPGRAALTTMRLSRTLSKSKACSGCPYSSIT